MAEAQAFNVADPPKSVTDPIGKGAVRPYPRHVYQYGLVGPQGPKPTVLPVAWGPDGKAVTNTYRLVNSEAEHAEALAEGWSDVPVLEKRSKASKSAH